MPRVPVNDSPPLGATLVKESTDESFIPLRLDDADRSHSRTLRSTS